MPARCCLQCHFLVKKKAAIVEALDRDTEFEQLTSALTMDRETILSLINGRGGAEDWFKLFACHYRIWGPWLCLENKHLFEEVKKPRGNCFFFPYKDGMAVPVACELGLFFTFAERNPVIPAAA